MRGRGQQTVSRDLETLLHVGIAGGASDEQLLERFMAGQGNAGHAAYGQAAFEEIVRRHGPMVLGVCHRVLADRQAAEDAFQATFLVLALKAHSVRKRESLGAWLHGVSARVARRARLTRQRRRETPLAEEGLARTDGDGLELEEVRWILDEELGRLPEKYRRPVVLCYLQGQTQEEAARVLGWSKGTVSGRLARAKDLMRSRLTRRGLSSTGAAVGILLAPDAATASVPASLLLKTIRAATVASLAKAETSLGSGTVVALARGVLKTMSLGRIKAVIPWLLFSLTIAAVGVSLYGNFRAVGLTPSPVRTPGSLARDLNAAPIVGVAYTPDGKTVIAAHGDGLIQFWDPRNHEEVGTIDVLSEAGARGEGLLSDFTMSPDGRLLAVVGSHRDSPRHRPLQGVWMWNRIESRLVRRIEVESARLQCLAFSPEGASLATGDESGKIRLWDIASGEELLTLKLGETAIGGIAFSPDGMTLAATSLGNGIQLWDLGGGRALGAVDGGSQPLALAPCFSPDGTLLVFGAPQGDVTLWNRARSGPQLRVQVPAQDSMAISFSPDGSSLAVCSDGTISVFGTGTGLLLWRVELEQARETGCVAYSPDGKSIVTGHGGVLTLLDAATGKLQSAH